MEHGLPFQIDRLPLGTNMTVSFYYLLPNSYQWILIFALSNYVRKVLIIS